MNEAYIFDALRTPRGKGKTSGALHEVKPINLLISCLDALKERNGLDTTEVDDLLVGCVSPINDQGANIAKAALLYAGWADSVAGMQLNRFCASGLETINTAAARIRSGWDQLIVAGGVESMSRVKMESDGGALLFDSEVMISSGYLPQGISADLIATIEGFTREQLDAYALQSQQRAAAAWDNQRFQSSIIPIYDQNELLVLDRDEYLRPNTTAEKLASLAPAFAAIGDWGFDAMALKKYPTVARLKHLHTAGNSSGIVDGAALVLVGSPEKGEALGLRPRARIRAVGTVGSEPTIMLQGPTPATQKALKNAGMTRQDIDLWEMNEAFAAPVLKYQQDMQIDPEYLNVNGGAIAMGHPLGATGAMLLGTLLDELELRDLNVGLVSLCVGGGMGIATIIERI
ncbi:MAG: acetyl-CoA C-acetyltransferase [Bacteroidota bacterium]